MDNQKFILAFIDSQNSESMLEQFFKDGAERGVIFEGLNINSDVMDSFRELKSRGYFPLGIIIDPTSDDTEFIYQRHPNQHESSKLIELQDTKSKKL